MDAIRVGRADASALPQGAGLLLDVVAVELAVEPIFHLAVGAGIHDVIITTMTRRRDSTRYHRNQ